MTATEERAKQQLLAHIELQHFNWFKAILIVNGAPSSIKDSAVRASCGYAASSAAFAAGFESGRRPQWTVDFIGKKGCLER